MYMRVLHAAVFLLLAGAWSAAANAQTQATIGTPFHSLNDSYFENIGFGFNFSFKGAPIGGANPRGVVGLGPNLQLQQNIQFQNAGLPGIPNGQGNPASAGTLWRARIASKFRVSQAEGLSDTAGAVGDGCALRAAQTG